MKPVKTVQDRCNAAIDSVLGGALQTMLDNVEPPPKKPWEVYPIQAVPVVGGDISLAAQVVEHREKAVKVSNGLTEFWLPRSQIRRITTANVIVTEWIYLRKSKYMVLHKNPTPQYAEWLKAEEVRKKHEHDFPMKPINWKFDNGDVR